MSAAHPSKVVFAVLWMRSWAAERQLHLRLVRARGGRGLEDLRHGATDRRTRILDTVKYSAPTALRGEIEKPV